MAKKAFKMKLIKDVDRKMKHDFILSQNKNLKKLRSKNFNFREDNRIKSIKAKKKMVQLKRDRNYLQKLKYDKMMLKRKRLDRTKLNSIKLNKLMTKLSREKSMLKDNNKKNRKRLTKINQCGKGSLKKKKNVKRLKTNF